MTSTCQYRKRGKICRKKSVLTLVGYGVDSSTVGAIRLLRDLSVRNAASYCADCAKLIDRRCASTHFVDDNGAPIDAKTGARTDLPGRA